MNSLEFDTRLEGLSQKLWQNKLIWELHKRIASYLRSNDVGIDLLAEPKLYPNNMNPEGIKWITYAFSTNAVRLTDLDDDDKVRYKKLADSCLEKVTAIIDGKDAQWAEMLRLTFNNFNDGNILCGDGKIVFINWAIEDNRDKNVATELPSDPKPKQDEASAPGFLSGDKRENSGDEQSHIAKEEVVAQDEVDAQDEASAVVPDDLDNNQLHSEPIISPTTLEHEPISSTPPISDARDDKPLKEEAPKIEEVDDADEVEEESAPHIGATEKTGKKRFPWWLLILLLLLAGIISYLFGCFSPKSIPIVPGIPIAGDSVKIGLDNDSLSNIALNRLNILVKDKKVDLQEVMKTISSEFSEPDVKVIFFDTTIYRIQVQVNESKRSELKNQLKQKLSAYNVLVFDEAVYNQKLIPNDPAVSKSDEGWYLEAIGAPAAWNITQGNPDITIAILDCGFDANQEDLATKIGDTYNTVTRNASLTGNAGTMDHGTHVAGTAAAIADNGKGISGIAAKSNLLLVRVSDQNGQMMTSSIVDGVVYAIQHGADVINMSLGKYFDPRVALMPEAIQESLISTYLKDEEYFWNNIFEYADQNGVTVVLAAGNQNVVIGLDPMQRSQRVINVSSVSPNIEKSSFSNYGRRSTISAPGERIFSTLPQNHYNYMDGTSMAAPIVTGAVALFKSIKPTITTDEIIHLIQSTGRPINSPLYIGPLLQLDKALEALKSGNIPSDNLPISGNCDDITRQIDSLQHLIDQLKGLCGSNPPVSGDTMKIPPVIDNTDFMIGMYKSTTELRNTADGSKIDLYFEFFQNNYGELTLVDQEGNKYKARLKLTVVNNSIEIDQLEDAYCPQNGDYFSQYNFHFEADQYGKAYCRGQNKTNASNVPEFFLIKINRNYI
jgi:subtilisin family serine protease